MWSLIKLVILIAIIAGVVGWWQDWFSISKSSDDSYTVKVNKDKAKGDLGKATDKLKEKIAGVKTVTGTLSSFDPIGKTARLKTADDEIPLKIDRSMLESGSTLNLAAFATGAKVCVKYGEKDGVNYVKTIEKAP